MFAILQVDGHDGTFPWVNGKSDHFGSSFAWGAHAPRYGWGLKVGEEDLDDGGVEHRALLSCGRPQRSH